MQESGVTEKLRQSCRRLLEEKLVDVVIGYGQPNPDAPPIPVFIRKTEDADFLVWNNLCQTNLASYLTHKNIKALGRIAVVVKGCDERTLVVLAQESQIEREKLYVIGIACDGVGDPLEDKCQACDVHVPRFADEVIGESKVEPATHEQRYAALDEFMKKSPEERLEYWKQEMTRCIRCYACRQSCPLCYCNQCIADKNRAAAFDTSATLKGNFGFHISRAFHQAGRCVGCGECARACPVGIDLMLLNQSLARAAEENFEYRGGMDPETPPVIGSQRCEDKENFIR